MLGWFGSTTIRFGEQGMVRKPPGHTSSRPPCAHARYTTFGFGNGATATLFGGLTLIWAVMIAAITANMLHNKTISDALQVGIALLAAAACEVLIHVYVRHDFRNRWASFKILIYVTGLWIILSSIF
jgi:hypothetical protein